MVAEKSLILDAKQVKQKLRRMAFEIYEHNFKEKNIVLAGIEGQGYVLATLLARELETISPLEVKLVKINIDKLAPQQSEITLDCEVKEIKKKCIVLVDDVLNTGRTFTYGMKPFLDIEVKKIEAPALVNPGLILFPIHAQSTGYDLPTPITIQDEVKPG